jgi:biopolymer transport protein TolR
MKRKAHPHEHTGELNIVPYLDIVVNLVMFMLMSMAGFITFQMINVTAPDVSDGPSIVDPANPPPKPEKEELVLNITIGKQGFFIAATGGVLPGDAPKDPKAPPPDPNTATPTIPVLPDGTYDFQKLTDKMVAIKKAYPDKSAYFLAADKDVRYDVIVQTMDATRGDSQHVLFPDVAFAAIQ